MRAAESAVIDVAGLDDLIRVLVRRGYRVLGPVARDNAIVYDQVTGVADLPRGWHDQQGPGSYRLHQEGDDELFGWAVGPQSWKRDFFPPSEVLWRARRNASDLQIENVEDAPARLAIIGARPCELAALSILDRVLLGGTHVDGRYAARRDEVFMVAVECGAPSDSCFCTSMGTGPAAESGYDLALTELVAAKPSDKPEAVTDEHRFVVRIGSSEGAAVLDEIAPRRADRDSLSGREAVLRDARRRISRALDTEGLPRLLADNIEHPRWAETAERCLACGNCTLVCPTCFCSDVVDTSDLTGMLERKREWSSCFDLDHSYLHGGAVRRTIAARYRQWLTHKLGTWQAQFGTSGCVGCGRCITWCPVGIDLTEEVAAIRTTVALLPEEPT